MPKSMPYFPFFVNDWLADPELHTCTMAAQGLWINLLSIAHKSARRGSLCQANGEPLSVEQISRLTGCPPNETPGLIQELLSTGTASMKDGIIFCRRMRREDGLSRARSKAGQKGGIAKAWQNSGKTPEEEAGKTPGKEPGKTLANAGNGNGIGDLENLIPSEPDSADSAFSGAQPPLGGALEGAPDSARAADPPEPDTPANGNWPAFLTCEWLFYHSGCAPSQREAGQLNKFFAGLIERGVTGERLRDHIRARDRPKGQPTWEFEEHFFPKATGAKGGKNYVEGSSYDPLRHKYRGT